MGCIGNDGTISSMTCIKDVNKKDMQVFWNSLKNTLDRNKKYFQFFDVTLQT